LLRADDGRAAVDGPFVGSLNTHAGLGPARMATRFGLVMRSRQIGGFLGAWLGGKAFDATGSFDWMWCADIVLAAGAALLHLPIRKSAKVLQTGTV
jgi:predicted MFS family arabinose efflux permease